MTSTRAPIGHGRDPASVSAARALHAAWITAGAAVLAVVDRPAAAPTASGGTWRIGHNRVILTDEPGPARAAAHLSLFRLTSRPGPSSTW